MPINVPCTLGLSAKSFVVAPLPLDKVLCSLNCWLCDARSCWMQNGNPVHTSDPFAQGLSALHDMPTISLASGGEVRLDHCS